MGVHQVGRVEHEGRVADGERARRAGALSVVGLVALLAATAIVSLPRLGLLPVFDDEAIAVWYAHVAAHPHHMADLFGGFDYAVPPLFIWLGAVAQRLYPDQLVALRAVSVLCGIASSAAIYLLARELYRDGALGLLAAVLCAFCPYEYMFSRMALLDTLVQLMGLLVALQSVRLYRRGSIEPRAAVLLGILLGLGQLSKGIATLFWLLPLLAWYVYDPGRSLARLRRSLLIAIPVAAALYAIILASGNARNLFRPFFTAIKYSVATPYPGYYASHPHESIVSLVGYNLGQWLSWQQTYVGYGLCAALLVALGIAVVSREPADRFLGLWLLAPLALMLVVKIYTSRYVLFTVPIELLLVSRACVIALRYARRLARGEAALGLSAARLRAGGILVVVVLALSYTAVFDASRDATLRNDPARSAMVDDDHWQYIAGWPSGYGLDRVERHIRARARIQDVTVVAAPTHQPINALLYGLAGNPHIHVRPLPLTRGPRVSPSAGGRKTAVFAVVETGKDDLLATEAAHPGWKPVVSETKPGALSKLVLLASN